jgi:hypothetical protein
MTCGAADADNASGETITIDEKPTSAVATAGGIVRDDATASVPLSRSGFIYSLFLRQWIHPAVGRAAKLMPRDPAIPTGTSRTDAQSVPEAIHCGVSPLKP